MKNIFSTGNKQYLIFLNENQIRIWNIFNNEEDTVTEPFIISSIIKCVSITIDTKYLIVVLADKSVRAWNFLTKKVETLLG